ncbi:MAG: glycosyltransferase [Candidatus Roizmanbacteria bacterium]|nr:glycosyltransferase [Candidatus Roizmanbacteria bacterium]
MLIKYGISAIIIAVGEPKYIFQVIQSIFNIVTEVVIIDIGLSAEWKNQLKHMQKVRIIQEKPVEYVELLREKSKQYAKNDYILMLDPDELVPPELATQILENYQKYDFISIPRKNIIFGKWIQHSRWWPDYQIRLFKKDRVSWSKNLHAQPKTTGNGWTVPPDENQALEHYNYESLDEYMTKMMRYAKADASTHLSSEETFTLSQALTQGSSEFISRFFASDGYKDGMHGFVLSFLQLMYYPLVYFYYWEGRKYENVETKTIISDAETFAKTLLYEILHWLSVKNITHSTSNLKRRIIRKLLK